MVFASGTIQIDEGQHATHSPVKYCKKASEAIALVNQLNKVIGARDYNRTPRPCPNCGGMEAIESPEDWEKGSIAWSCPCGMIYQTGKKSSQNALPESKIIVIQSNLDMELSSASAKTYPSGTAEYWQSRLKKMCEVTSNYYYLDAQLVRDRILQEYKRSNAENECRVLYRTFSEVLTGKYPSKVQITDRYHDIILPFLKQQPEKTVVILDKAHLLSHNNLYTFAADAGYFTGLKINTRFVLSGEESELKEKLRRVQGIYRFVPNISLWEELLDEATY